jgi:hypothetical protein
LLFRPNCRGMFQPKPVVVVADRHQDGVGRPRGGGATWR